MELVEGYLKIALSSSAVYLFIIVAIRLFGKKELAQLSIIDLVFILLISNAVQNAMVGSDSTLSGGLVAASTLFIINYLFKFLLYRFPKLGNYVQGNEMLLIYSMHSAYYIFQFLKIADYLDFLRFPVYR